jgi:hypothetical protein
LKFELVSDTGVSPNKVWTNTVELEGQIFSSTGRGKKVAKQQAAKYALIKIFNILCVSGKHYILYILRICFIFCSVCLSQTSP